MIISIAICLVAAEVVLRAAKITYPKFYTQDDYRAWAHLPGAKGWFKSEGNGYVKINSLGERDREHSLKKPPGTLRIAVLGDSFTAALQVDREEAYWSVMEKMLNDNCETLGGKKVEAINLGVSGYGTAHELMTFRHVAGKYDPDMILLAFLPANDIRNNSKKLEPERRNLFFTRQNGVLSPDLSFRKDAYFISRNTESARRWIGIINKSYLLQLVFESKRAFVEKMRAAKRTGATAKPSAEDNQILEAGLDSNVYLEPKSADWKEAWEITDELLLMLRDETKQRGEPLVMAILSSGIEIHPDKKTRDKFMKQIGSGNLYYPSRRLESFAKSNDIETINLVPPLKEYSAKTRELLHGFKGGGLGHWNEAGHREAGKILADDICAMIGKQQ